MQSHTRLSLENMGPRFDDWGHKKWLVDSLRRPPASLWKEKAQRYGLYSALPSCHQEIWMIEPMPSMPWNLTISDSIAHQTPKRH